MNLKTMTKKTMEHVIDALYMLCQSYIHWYLMKFIYPYEKKQDSRGAQSAETKVVKCPDCGSVDFTNCSFPNGTIYHKCSDCGRNWM